MNFTWKQNPTLDKRGILYENIAVRIIFAFCCKNMLALVLADFEYVYFHLKPFLFSLLIKTGASQNKRVKKTFGAFLFIVQCFFFNKSSFLFFEETHRHNDLIQFNSYKNTVFKQSAAKINVLTTIWLVPGFVWSIVCLLHSLWIMRWKVLNPLVKNSSMFPIATLGLRIIDSKMIRSSASMAVLNSSLSSFLLGKVRTVVLPSSFSSMKVGVSHKLLLEKKFESRINSPNFFKNIWELNS